VGIRDLFKKKDDTDALLGSESSFDPTKDFGSFSNPNDFGSQSSMQQQGYHDQLQPSVNLSTQQFAPSQPVGGSDLQKDMQIISLKLDAIKAELDSMNQRIKNIENIAQKEQQQTPQKKWY
jgi:hypothetical protein